MVNHGIGDWGGASWMGWGECNCSGSVGVGTQWSVLTGVAGCLNKKNLVVFVVALVRAESWVD